MATPVTLLITCSVALLTSLFTRRKVLFTIGAAASLAGAFMSAPKRFFSPPVYVWASGWDHLHLAIANDAGIVVGSMAGELATLLFMNRHRDSLEPKIAPCLALGAITGFTTGMLMTLVVEMLRHTWT